MPALCEQVWNLFIGFEQGVGLEGGAASATCEVCHGLGEVLRRVLPNLLEQSHCLPL